MYGPYEEALVFLIKVPIISFDALKISTSTTNFFPVMSLFSTALCQNYCDDNQLFLHLFISSANSRLLRPSKVILIAVSLESAHFPQLLAFRWYFLSYLLYLFLLLEVLDPQVAFPLTWISFLDFQESFVFRQTKSQSCWHCLCFWLALYSW